MSKKVGGRPKKYTLDYCKEVLNDFVLRNPNAEITPTALTKWSISEKFIKSGVGQIPRYMWYNNVELAEKIKQFNSVGYLIRAESIEEVGNFNLEKLCEKYGCSKKLAKELELFVDRANKAIEIAHKANEENENLRKYKAESEKLKEKLEEEITLKNFYKNKYESLTFASTSKKSRVENRIKGNVLSFNNKNLEHILDEFKIENIEKEVMVKKQDLEIDDRVMNFFDE